MDLSTIQAGLSQPNLVLSELCFRVSERRLCYEHGHTLKEVPSLTHTKPVLDEAAYKRSQIAEQLELPPKEQLATSLGSVRLSFTPECKSHS